MIADPELYSFCHTATVKVTHKLLDSVLPKMTFNEEDIIMDIGCGPGDVTKDVIFRRIPKLKKIIGVDEMPDMIAFARTHQASDQIEYHVANIEDRCSLNPWEGEVSKVCSLYCFHWLKDQKKGFQNIYNLLKPRGEAALVFILSAVLWDCYPFIVNDSKWKTFLKPDAKYPVPDSHYLNHGADYFRRILEDVGFEVLTCVEENKTYIFKDDTEFKNYLKMYAAPTYRISDDLKEEILEDFMGVFKKLNGGTLENKYKILMVHIRKP